MFKLSTVPFTPLALLYLLTLSCKQWDIIINYVGFLTVSVIFVKFLSNLNTVNRF